MTTLADFVPAFRDFWAAQWTEEIQIDRVTGLGSPDADGVQNELLLKPKPLDAPASGTPNALVRPLNMQAADFEAGEEQKRENRYRIRAVHSLVDIQREDRVTVVASTYDLELVAAIMVVREVRRNAFNGHRFIIARLDSGQGPDL